MDIKTIQYGGDPYLLQFRVNRVSNAKQFRTTQITHKAGVVDLCELGTPADFLEKMGDSTLADFGDGQPVAAFRARDVERVFRAMTDSFRG